MALSILRIAPPNPLYREVLRLRHEVLRVPLGMSLYHEDLSGDVHDIILATLDGERVIGCVMLTPKEHHTLKLRQMAIVPEAQKSGIGTQLVQAAEAAATSEGYATIVLHARYAAIGFYEKLGYRRVGGMFHEVSIPHIKMEKQLA